jgi:hypothetical protein
LDFKTKISHQLEQPKPKPLLAVYDLAVLPYSFDIVHFICNAEIERIKNACDSIKFIFVAHANDPAPDRLDLVGKENYWQYIYNVMLECVRCYSGKKSILIFNNREEFVDFYESMEDSNTTFPTSYDPKNPPWYSGQNKLPVHCFGYGIEYFRQSSRYYCISPPNDQISLAQKWLNKECDGRIPVTITLREYNFSTNRNSSIKDWQQLVESYPEKQYQFIVLRDYDSLYTTPSISGKNVSYCNEAVIDASFRAALYQECELNLGVNNGPMMLAMQNRSANFIIFKIVCNARGCKLEEAEKSTGLRFNNNIPSPSKFQKLVWETDDFKILKRETDEMLAKLAIQNFED